MLDGTLTLQDVWQMHAIMDTVKDANPSES